MPCVVAVIKPFGKAFPLMFSPDSPPDYQYPYIYLSHSSGGGSFPYCLSFLYQLSLKNNITVVFSSALIPFNCALGSYSDFTSNFCALACLYFLSIPLKHKCGILYSLFFSRTPPPPEYMRYIWGVRGGGCAMVFHTWIKFSLLVPFDKNPSGRWQ